MEISLRKSIVQDLDVLFQNQSDEDAHFMAAFTSEDPFNKDKYIKKWTRLLGDTTVHMQSIIANKEVIGCVAKFEMHGESDITYALNKTYWGNGITSEAVKLFLKLEKKRPLFGRTAFDNLGSQKVLEKNGFVKIDENKEFANARGKEIMEFIYKLD